MVTFKLKLGSILMLIAVLGISNLWANSPKNLSELEVFSQMGCNDVQQVPLTRERIRKFIKTSISEFKLHQKMKQRVSRDDNLIKTYYEKRKVLLQSQGWSVAEFEATQDRIFAAQNAMKTQANMKSEKDFKKEIEEIKANSYGTAKQKEQIIQAMKLDRKNMMEIMINPSKADWDVVKTYHVELEQLGDYRSENRSDPPVLD